MAGGVNNVFVVAGVVTNDVTGAKRCAAPTLLTRLERSGKAPRSVGTIVGTGCHSVPSPARTVFRGSRVAGIRVRIEAVGSRSELILSVVSVLVSFGPVRRNPPTAAARLRAGIMKSPTRSEHLYPDLESVRPGAGC